MKRTHSAFSLRTVRQFAHQHDDLPAFHAAYLVLTFLAAALLNLGFFGVLILIHMALDVVKYREVHGYDMRMTLSGIIRESIVDITLFFFGLTVAVYLHPSVTGMMGIKGLMLAEITILRSAGIVAPKLKILYDFLKILSHVDHYLSRLHPRFGKNIAPVEVACIISLLVTLGLLVAAPVALLFDSAFYLNILLGELTPWKL